MNLIHPHDPSRGLFQFLITVAWLALGALLGLVLGHFLSQGSTDWTIASALLFPAAIPLGWLLMLGLGILTLPAALYRWIRDFNKPRPRHTTRVSRDQNQVRRLGWVFVISAFPTSLTAGLLADAPMTYLAVGLLYGFAMRFSAALQEIPL